ncbi:MAG: L-seryl-tRNA(Sec) selenium transferase [Chloroflexi bacterium GWC2_73_18]|nr:MAG: L-seryl-tRNA(Sec) selenium transferase [Chloroflexi bacterium GWC2_73_18]
MATGRPPSVARLIRAADLGGAYDHTAGVAVAREVIAGERARLARGSATRPLEALAAELADRLEGFASAGLVPVVNASGVILHTNLGRAPWSTAAIRAAAEAASGYSLLELDRATGRRGPRFRQAEDHLVALTGADDALVVNNNAAAVALAAGIAGRRAGVAVARGELVEIGGGVRIPEVIARAGLRLVEVGTTNRTRLTDYQEVLADGRARLVLRVHASNFRMEGFVERPEAAELAELTHRHGAPLVDDLGSGALLDTARFGLAHEPMPRESVAAGIDLVCFSGDKLLGGPQAGLIAGRRELVAKLRRDPLARAMRADKATLAALAATLGAYRAGRAVEELPVWRMIAESEVSVRARAEAVLAGLPEPLPGGAVARLAETRATVGGGSLPGETLPSWAVALRGVSAERLATALRAGEPAILGRIERDALLLDLRTVTDEEAAALPDALTAALWEIGTGPDPRRRR